MFGLEIFSKNGQNFKNIQKYTTISLMKTPKYVPVNPLTQLSKTSCFLGIILKTIGIGAIS